MRLFYFFLLSCLSSVVRPYHARHITCKINAYILFHDLYFFVFVMGLVYWPVKISKVFHVEESAVSPCAGSKVEYDIKNSADQGESYLPKMKASLI